MEVYGWDDNNEHKAPAKVVNNYQASFEMPKTQWSYREEAFNLKQGNDETIWQLDVHLNNGGVKCWYP